MRYYRVMDLGGFSTALSTYVKMVRLKDDRLRDVKPSEITAMQFDIPNLVDRIINTFFVKRTFSDKVFL